MLEITVPDANGWDPTKEEFVHVKGGTLYLEHSLVSIQKWEAKYHKPYLSQDQKTTEEIVDYIRCMTIFPKNPDPEMFNYIPEEEINKIVAYIDDPMTATTFSDKTNENGGSRKKEIITAEIVYYWMITLEIPMEYRKWHINQLLTLIRVCEIKNAPQKKMGKNEIMARNKALNAQRRARSRSKG